MMCLSGERSNAFEDIRIQRLARKLRTDCVRHLVMVRFCFWKITRAFVAA